MGLLNSSIACFWMKQVFFPKGSATHDVSKDGLQPENNTFEFSATGMLSFPLPPGWQDARLVKFARALDRLATERQQLTPAAIIAAADNLRSATQVSAVLARADELDKIIQARMVFKEELDWVCYELMGL